MENYTQMGGSSKSTYIQTKMYQLKHLGKGREGYDFYTGKQKFELNKKSK